MLVDTEGAVRSWLRGEDAIGPQVFFAMPKGTPTLPLITIERIGGSPQIGQVPIEDVRLSLSCWASTKKEAGDISRALSRLVFEAENARLDDEVWLYGGTIDSVLWLPDPDNDKLVRYVVDVTLTVGSIPV